MFNSTVAPFSILTAQENWVVGSASVQRSCVLSIAIVSSFSATKSGFLNTIETRRRSRVARNWAERLLPTPKLAIKASSRSDLHRPALARQHKIALELRQ